MDVPFEDFFDLFNQFSYEVKVGNYSKMDYSMWKDLRDALHNCSDDVICVNLYSDRIVVEICGCGGYWQFMLNDHSFGDYLYYWLFDHWCKKEYVTDPNGQKFAYTVSKNKSDIKNTANDVTCESVKEDKVMNFNFDFGPVDTSKVRMSMYGLAIKNKVGAWVSYNTAAGEIMDVDVFNFDGGKFLYKMPVATKDIAIGDVVIHNGYPMFVVYIPEDGKALGVVDTFNGERKEVMLPKSPFGFNFATKVVNFLGNMTAGAATAENPFGNMWMLMAMSGDTKMDDMLPLALMAGGNMDMSNPMLMWALMGNRTNDPMMLAMAMGAFNAAPHVCNCGGHCGEYHE
jgi:hypothetical protein